MLQELIDRRGRLKKRLLLLREELRLWKINAQLIDDIEELQYHFISAGTIEDREQVRNAIVNKDNEADKCAKEILAIQAQLDATIPPSADEEAVETEEPVLTPEPLPMWKVGTGEAPLLKNAIKTQISETEEIITMMEGEITKIETQIAQFTQ